MTALPSLQPWTNPLPAWILEAAAYQRLRSGPRATLQAIADTCNRPLPDGSLLGAFGGSSILGRASVSKRTFWRHLERLEAAGFVVTVGRGGVIGGRNYANQYAIPGAPGALDSRRVRRRLQRMVLNEAGALEPEILEAGTQPELWPEPPETVGGRESEGGSVKMTGGVVSKRAGGSVKMAHNHKTMVKTMVKNHGSSLEQGRGGEQPKRGARRRLTRTGPRLSRMVEADLLDDRRLSALLEQAIERGWMKPGDWDRLIWFSAAEHALRVGRSNRPGLFVSTIKANRLYITQEDEERARMRIKRLDRPGELRRAEAPEIQPPASGGPIEKPRLSQTEKLARAAMEVARGSMPAALVIMARQTGEQWTEERLRAALGEG